jgi:transposase InsO family protein
LVAIDKFTKWIEVKPVTCPKVDRVLDFLDELVHRYGLPHRIITDLGSNFNNHQFWEYCENSGIDVRYVSVAHPRANGQVERANGMVLDALKKRLHDAANFKGASGSRNYPTHSGGYVLSLPSQRGNPLTSWSTAPKQSSLLTSYGTHQQWNTTTKASLKTADELTSTASKKLAALP